MSGSIATPGIQDGSQKIKTEDTDEFMSKLAELTSQSVRDLLLAELRDGLISEINAAVAQQIATAVERTLESKFENLTSQVSEAVARKLEIVHPPKDKASGLHLSSTILQSQLREELGQLIKDTMESVFHEQFDQPSDSEYEHASEAMEDVVQLNQGMVDNTINSVTRESQITRQQIHGLQADTNEAQIVNPIELGIEELREIAQIKDAERMRLRVRLQASFEKSSQQAEATHPVQPDRNPIERTVQTGSKSRLPPKIQRVREQQTRPKERDRIQLANDRQQRIVVEDVDYSPSNMRLPKTTPRNEATLATGMHQSRKFDMTGWASVKSTEPPRKHEQQTTQTRPVETPDNTLLSRKQKNEGWILIPEHVQSPLFPRRQCSIQASFNNMLGTFNFDRSSKFQPLEWSAKSSDLGFKWDRHALGHPHGIWYMPSLSGESSKKYLSLGLSVASCGCSLQLPLYSERRVPKGVMRGQWSEPLTFSVPKNQPDLLNLLHGLGRFVAEDI